MQNIAKIDKGFERVNSRKTLKTSNIELRGSES